MNNTVLYCRTAHTCQFGEDELQLEYLRRYALDNGYYLYMEYGDWGESGATLNRPFMQKLISGVKAGEIKRVIVKDLSRLSRNVSHLFELSSLFQEHGVEFISVNDGGVMGTSKVLNLESIALEYRKQSRRAV